MSLVGLGVRASMRRCSIIFIVLAALALPATAAAEPHALRLLTDGTNATDADANAQVTAESGDGSRIVFSTSEPLAPTDTDVTFDLYARTGTAAPVHLTDTPDAPDAERGAWFAYASADAGYVYFETAERMLASDTDVSEDVYARTPAGALVHVSERPVGPDAEHHAELLAVSDDGLRACFYTKESLDPADGDTDRDVYELGPGGLRLISEDPFGIDESAPVRFEFASPDGDRVYFLTQQSLAMSDADQSDDVYMRAAGGGFAHISDGGSNPDSNREAYFAGESASGDRVWFETDESLTASDSDGAVDIYQRAPSGALLNVTDGSAGPDTENPAYLVGWSADGSHLFVETAEKFSATDTDVTQDIYRRDADGSFAHLSDGPGDPDGVHPVLVKGVSDDGSTLVLATLEQLMATDTDASFDLYLRTAAGALVHLSDDRTGLDDALKAEFLALSNDGSRVLFETEESLTASDGDGKRDVYLWSGGELVNLSDNPTGPDAELPAFDGIWSPDLTRVYFITAERLAAEDNDAGEDGYVAFPAPAPPGGDATPPRSAEPQPGDSTPPRLSGLRVLPKQLARGAAAIRFSLSEPAQVQFSVRRGKRLIGGFARAAKANANRLRFPPNLAKRLSGGRLELGAVPRDAAGNLGDRRRARFAPSPALGRRVI